MSTHRHVYVREKVGWFSPEQLLSVRWRSLAAEQLAMHLRRIIVAERRCILGKFPRHLGPLFRWRRIAIAKRFVLIGGTVSSLVFLHPNGRGWSSGMIVPPNVPLKYSWPGVHSLVPLPSRSQNEE